MPISNKIAWACLISVILLATHDPALGGGADKGPGIISFNAKQFAPVLPAGSISNVSAPFFDDVYAKEQDTQHLGVDIAVPEGSTIVSPVYGKVIKANIVPDAWSSYIVIQDFNTGWQHVIGHIDSDLDVGATVAAGQAIGTVVTAGTGPHVHWGMNRDLNAALSRDWGWGRAPVAATKEQAISKGWVDPLGMI